MGLGFDCFDCQVGLSVGLLVDDRKLSLDDNEDDIRGFGLYKLDEVFANLSREDECIVFVSLLREDQILKGFDVVVYIFIRLLFFY